MTTTNTERSPDHGETTGWVGWITFAGVMMLMVGIFHSIAGFVGIFKDDYYVVPKEDLVISVDYSTWGWIHLIFGIVIILAGCGLLAGQMWARVVAVILAMISAIANVVWLSATPWWSAIMITIDILVIWAVTVHGREMKYLH